jgi:hypothetical protein
VTASLPASAATFLGFERRLRSASNGTDFAISLSARGLDWLFESRRWPQLSKLVGKWRAHSAFDSRTVWLEFDVSETAFQRHPPNVFISIDRGDAQSIAPPAEIDGPGLRGCMRVCPSSVTRFQLGFMFSRATAAVRFCAMPMNHQETMAFLTAVAWPGSLACVSQVLAPYEPFCDGFGVDLDLLDSPAPSLGVELLYTGRVQEHQPDSEPRWRSLFDQLIRDGFCTRRERNALLSWVSQRKFSAPVVTRLFAALFYPDHALLHGTLYTGLQHVKLCFGPKASIHAKAYFGAVLEADE